VAVAQERPNTWTKTSTSDFGGWLQNVYAKGIREEEDFESMIQQKPSAILL
jgi:hypothetical protein